MVWHRHGHQGVETTAWASTQRIYHAPGQASFVELPVVARSAPCRGNELGTQEHQPSRSLVL